MALSALQDLSRWNGAARTDTAGLAGSSLAAHARCCSQLTDDGQDLRRRDSSDCALRHGLPTLARAQVAEPKEPLVHYCGDCHDSAERELPVPPSTQLGHGAAVASGRLKSHRRMQARDQRRR
jgi:hypothetical protein